MKEEKISLCVIVGNAENYIRRFLTAFKGVADEFVVVRACGALAPDKTLKIAEREFGAVTAEYHNAEGRETWPHVDDFAAARNLAFSMGTGDWLMWADTDDLIESDSIAAVRAAVAEAGQETLCICFPYNVPDDRLIVTRERLVRKGRAKWGNPIHEVLTPDDVGGKAACTIDAEIIHSPQGPRTTNNARNLRIMEAIEEEDRSTSVKFHLTMTLRNVGRTEDAISAAKTALLDPGMESPERYELLMVLAQMAPNAKQNIRLLEACAHEAPERREAWGELALIHLKHEDYGRAAIYAEIMSQRPPLRQIPWNIRRKFWGWLGIELEAMALRVNGNHARAEAIEFNFFHKNGSKISLLHATRGRLKEALAARKKWLEKAQDPDAIEHIFAIDEDDEESKPLSLYRHIVVPVGGGCVRAWNAAAHYSSGQILVQLSDDWEPPLYWDRTILEHIGDHAAMGEEAVLQISDGHRKDDLLCMAIMTRARWLAQGYMFHPAFKSMYSDNWFSFCAFRDTVVVAAKDVVFEHLHPAFGLAPWDKTYNESNAKGRYEEGEMILHRLMHSHERCRGWFDFSGVYNRAAGLAVELDWKQVVEVGNAYGKSLIYLAQHLRPETQIHSVDWFRGSAGEEGRYSQEMEDEFRCNLTRCGVDGRVKVHVASSAEGATQFQDGTVDFVFLDAGHDVDGIRADIAAWWPKVTRGGVLAGHDYAHSADVRQAVDELFPECEKIESCWWKEKT